MHTFTIHEQFSCALVQEPNTSFLCSFWHFNHFQSFAIHWVIHVWLSVHFHNQTTENYVLIEVKGKLTTHPYLITLQGNIICQDSLITFHCLNKDLLFLTRVLFIHQYTVEDSAKCSCQGQSTGLCLKKKRYHLQGTMSGWSGLHQPYFVWLNWILEHLSPWCS